MLRTSRPLVASSSRAIASQKASITSLRRLPFVAADQSVATGSTASKAVLSQLVPIIHKTRYATKTPSGLQSGIDKEEDKKIAQRKLESNPESVSTESSVRHLYEPRGEDEVRPVREGVKEDLETVKDTFALTSVPKESYYLGLAGTLPYLGTSISTVYLSWVLNTEWPTSSAIANNLLISQDTARHLLGVLEPIQLGYGAIIISFLGAIHWGLEYAEKTRNYERTRFRYGVGVLAPIVAWPSFLMPMEFALTSQFAAFVGLYFADSRATVRGWAPSWYGTYRFVLTAVVGAAIVISLIGRTKVGDAQPRLTGLGEKLRERRGEEDYDEKWQEREQQDKEKMKKEKEEAEKKKEEEEEKKAKEAEGKEKKEKKGGKEGKEGDKGEKGEDEKGEEKKGEEKKGEEKKGEEKKDEEK